MTDFITLDQAKAHLRVDSNVEDDDIQHKLDEAQSIVLDYVKNPLGIWYDTDGVTPLPTPLPIISAIKLVLGNLYLYREGGDERYTVHVEPISGAVVNILMRLRDPALA